MLNALAARGHEVLYLALDTPPAEFGGTVLFKRIPFPISARKGVFFWGLFTVWSPIYLAYKAVQLKPDRIAVFGSYYSTVAQLGKKLSGAKSVLFLRSLVQEIERVTGGGILRRFAAATFDSIGMRCADKIVCMTDAMRASVIKMLGSSKIPIAVLPNDITGSGKQTGIKAPRPERVRLLAGGVLDERKNIGFLLEALATLKDEGVYEKISLTVAGTGMLEEELIMISERLGLENVDFVGWCSHMPDLFKEGDVFVHPARHEGIPNIVLEALGFGLPILVSDIPEHREVVVSERLLFSIEGTTDLRSKLTRLLNDPESGVELAERSKEVADRYTFDWDEQVSGHVTAFLEDL